LDGGSPMSDYIRLNETIDREVFFSEVRETLFGGSLTQGQVDGMNATLDVWVILRLTDLRWLAYILGTTYHEVGKLMLPVREGFKTYDKDARKVVASREYGKEDAVSGEVYYGRGNVQLTWADNYRTMGSLLGVDLFAAPDIVLGRWSANFVQAIGMTRGMFTGKKLDDYFNETTEDWVNARRIVNGTDRAETIAGYAKKFHTALKDAQIE